MVGFFGKLRRTIAESSEVDLLLQMHKGGSVRVTQEEPVSGQAVVLGTYPIESPISRTRSAAFELLRNRNMGSTAGEIVISDAGSNDTETLHYELHPDGKVRMVKVKVS